MKKEKSCAGFRDGLYTCKFGFNQSNICAGNISENDKYNVPQCCNEEICGKLYNKTGGAQIVYNY